MNETARLSVLVVDDEPAVREVLRRWLERAGYATRQAEHAQAALEMIAASEPAVVICDVEMPGENGLWLIGQIREKYPNVAAILCTHVDDVPPVVSLQGGVIHYLLKPFRHAQVIAATAEAVTWHQSESRRSTAAPQSLDAWLKGNEE